MTGLHDRLDALRDAGLYRRMGWVREVQGHAIDAQGPDAALGEFCRIKTGGRHAAGAPDGLLAEVVGFKPGRVTLMPYGPPDGIAAGSEIEALGAHASVAVGDALLGRVIDCFGEPLDGKPRPAANGRRPLRAAPINPLRRPPIDRVFETGIRCIDGLLTLGKGQRVGIFAGSGVGKSTLLGMLARHMARPGHAGDPDGVNVIALIGERGREVREFIAKRLGEEGLARSVVIVATSDQPALSRIRACHAALAIAEHFRDEGRSVLLTMDSITRFAMARREVGLAAGEPPTARGYTPSVFAELPPLCERCGTAPGGGSITALFTVLVEGDDLNEPISDALRAILDGHIVLSRQLAHRGHYPAIDALRSVSRLMPELADAGQRRLATRAVEQLDILERNRAMVDIGVYKKGDNPKLDQALEIEPGLREWMRQEESGASRVQAIAQLAEILRGGAP